MQYLAFSTIVKHLSGSGIEYRLRDAEFREVEDLKKAFFLEIVLGPQKDLKSFYTAAIVVKDSSALEKSSMLSSMVSKTATLEVPKCLKCGSTKLCVREGRLWCLECSSYVELGEGVLEELEKALVSIVVVDTSSTGVEKLQSFAGDAAEVLVEGSVAIPRLSRAVRSFNVLYTATHLELKRVVEDLGLRALAKLEKTPIAPNIEKLSSALELSKETVAKFLEISREPKMTVRLTKAASLAEDAVVERFRHLKNFSIMGSGDLGLHCFDGKRYRECEGDVQSFIKNVYRELGLEKLGIKYTALVREVVKMLEDRFREYLKYETSKIAFENCVFDWETLRCEPHSPEEVVFHYIPHELDTDVLKEMLSKLVIEESDVVKHAPRTLKAFKEWARDKWMLLFELIGFVLYPKPYKKAVLFIDAPGKLGDTGKSTFIRYLQLVLGKENYSNIPLQYLVDPDHKFAASHIYRKLANLYADLPERAVSDVGTFKVLTGGDSIIIERKYREPFTWTPHTKHIFSANIPPPIGGADEAFWRRWLVVEFYGDFAEKVREFEKSLVNETPKAVAIGIAAFHKVLARGSFSFENTERDAKHLWLSRSDSVYSFMFWATQSGVLAKADGSKAWTRDLYEIYAKYCEYSDRSAVSDSRFTRRIKELGYSVKRSGNVSYLPGYALDKERARKLLEEL